MVQDAGRTQVSEIVSCWELRENSTQLTDLVKHAETKGVANYMVQDAGRTQVREIVSCLLSK